MTEVQPFRRSLIEAVLKRRGIKYLRDSSDDYYAMFDPSEAGGDERHVTFRAEGTDEDIYSVRVFTPTLYEPEHWPELLALVNRWNCERRFPKAYLAFRPGKQQARLMTEGQIDLAVGVHEELLDNFTMVNVACGFDFFKWVREERRPAAPAEPVTAEDLERWWGAAS